MNDRPDQPRDPFDDLLASARWPEPSRESIKRLESSWRSLTVRRWRIAPAMMTAAAAIVIVAGVWMFLTSSHPPAAPLVAVIAPTPVSLDVPRLRGRALTSLERSILSAQILKESRKPATAKATTEPVTQARATSSANPPIVEKTPENKPRQPLAAPAVDIQLCLERIANESTRSEGLVMVDRSPPPTDALIGRLADPRTEIRLAAALALGRIDGPATTRRLIQMVADNQCRREAFIALASSRSKEAQAFMQQATQSSRLSGLARSTLAMSEIQHNNEVQ